MKKPSNYHDLTYEQRREWDRAAREAEDAEYEAQRARDDAERSQREAMRQRANHAEERAGWQEEVGQLRDEVENLAEQVDAAMKLNAELLTLLGEACDALPHGDLTTRIAAALAKARTN